LRDHDTDRLKNGLEYGKSPFKQGLLPDKEKPFVFSHAPALAAGEKNSCHIVNHGIFDNAPP
jgi:hypothetical protein